MKRFFSTLAIIPFLVATVIHAGPIITKGGINLSNLGAIGTSSITDTGLTANKPVFTDGSKILISTGTLDVNQGGTGAVTLAVGGILLGNAANPVAVLATGATTEMLVGGGAGTNPVWTTATGTGAPVRAGSPALITPNIGVATATSVNGVILSASTIGPFTIGAASEVTNALQPAFLARPTAQLTNVTGDATFYTVVFATEIFDQGGDFDGTSTFTAPVTGPYMFSERLFISGLDAGHTTHQAGITTSNRGYSFDQEFAANPFTISTNLGVAVLADMDAGDTATVYLYVTGGAGGKIVDIGIQSYFSGYLAH